jgi:hypothetical protein
VLQFGAKQDGTPPGIFYEGGWKFVAISVVDFGLEKGLCFIYIYIYISFLVSFSPNFLSVILFREDFFFLFFFSCLFFNPFLSKFSIFF